VPVHRDFLAINLWRGADGDLWLVDWDNVDRGPPLTEDLAFWMGGVARRAGPRGTRQTEQVLRLLRRRGGDAETREAIEWRLRHKPEEALPAAQKIRDGIQALLK